MVLEESPSEGLRLGCYRRPTSAQELIGIVRWALIGQPGLPASNHHKGPNQFYLTFPWPPLAVAAGDKSVVVRWFLELFWLLFWQKSVGLFLDQMDFKTLLWWLFGPQRNCFKSEWEHTSINQDNKTLPVFDFDSFPQLVFRGQFDKLDLTSLKQAFEQARFPFAKAKQPFTMPATVIKACRSGKKISPFLCNDSTCLILDGAVTKWPARYDSRLFILQPQKFAMMKNILLYFTTMYLSETNHSSFYKSDLSRVSMKHQWF